MPTERQQEIAEMYAAGATLSTIFKETGAYAPQIYLACDLCGVPRRGSRGQREESIDEEIEKDEKWNEFARKVLKLYFDEDMTGAAIAESLGVQYNKVLKVLHKHRVQLFPGRRQDSWKKKRMEVLKALAEKPDMSVDEIQGTFGVSLDGIYKILSWHANQQKAEARKEIDVLRRKDSEALVDEVVRRIREEFGVIMNRQGLLDGRVAGLGGLGIGLVGDEATTPTQLELPFFDV